MKSVEVNNLTQVEIDQEFIKKIIKEVLREEEREGDVSVAFIGPGRMRKLNRMYRGKNRTTDVLSFPGKEVSFEQFKIGDFKEVEDLGEIVVCLREVKKNAKRAGISFDEELVRVLIHGTLHLLGYDHEKSEEEKEMRKREEKHLGKILSSKL